MQVRSNQSTILHTETDHYSSLTPGGVVPCVLCVGARGQPQLPRLRPQEAAKIRCRNESVRSTDGCPSGAPLAELNVSSSSEPSSQPSEEEDSSMFSASSKTRRRYGRSSTITAINLQSTVVVHMSSEAHIHAALTTRALALSQLV